MKVVGNDYQDMTTLLGRYGYVTLIVPKGLDLERLKLCKKVVNFQLDLLIKHEKEAEEARKSSQKPEQA